MRIVSNIVNTPLLASDLQDTGGTTVLSLLVLVYQINKKLISLQQHIPV